MFLTYEQIKSAAHGVSYVEKTEDSFLFSRFTPEQRDIYLQRSSDILYIRTRATAGIRLCFLTDSGFLRLRYRMTKGSGKPYGWFDLYENRVLIAHFGGEFQEKQELAQEIALSEGMKKVEIYFPWSAAAEILSLEVEDGASVHPVSKKRTMLAFGDSIAQGNDAIYPSRSCQNRLSDLLNASCINKAVGGDKFFPELLDCEEDVKPDLITVAYGTNDWSGRDPAAYEDNCRRFFDKLKKRYPDARIFAVTPLWRGDLTKDTPFGAPLWEASRLIERICLELKGITVIRGDNLTPRLPEFYSDGRLHPNDMGFDFYSENLYAAIRKALEL